MNPQRRLVVPEQYDPARITDDLSDMVMRILLAAQRAGRLEEVLERLDPQIDLLTGRNDD